MKFKKLCTELEVLKTYDIEISWYIIESVLGGFRNFWEVVFLQKIKKTAEMAIFGKFRRKTILKVEIR